MTKQSFALKNRLRRLHSDERGVSMIIVAGSMMGFLAATALAIDVGLFMTARTQAQRAADAGALAGATALVFNSFDDRTATGPVVTSAINTAESNLVVGEVPSVTPVDVTFPMNPTTGISDIVEVTVYRSTLRSNPINLLMARVFGTDTADITATARATAAPAGNATCVLPLTIPDKWTEVQDPLWDPLDDFNMYDTKGGKQNEGDPLPNPDLYVEPGKPGATGYDRHKDKGLQLVLKENNDNKVAPSMYNPWDLPGSVGGSDYSDNISGCNPNMIPIGHKMTPENGNMEGPTKHGADELIAQDPKAYWSDSCKCVKGSDPKFRQSPRIRMMPLYNPVIYAEGQKTGKSQPQLEVVNYLGVFVESVSPSGEVIGRVTPVLGKLGSSGTPPVGAFASYIMLVK